MDLNRRGPSQEYLLQGSILDDSIDLLLHRLKGMCDNAEDGLVKYEEQEIVYTLREGPNSSVSVRVRKQLNVPDQPWTLCYLGNPELANRPTTVRTCVEVNCTSNVCAFLQELGFQMDYEYISHGWLFKKARLKATVSKIFRVPSSLNSQESMKALTKSHLVEVSTISGSSNEQAANEVKAFADQLKPHVNLEKIDPKRLPTQ